MTTDKMVQFLTIGLESEYLWSLSTGNAVLGGSTSGEARIWDCMTHATIT